MTHDVTTYNQQREQALVRFGALLKAWRLRNGWTQHTASKWAKAAGFQPVGPGNTSRLERGIAGQPSPGTLFMLADLNARIARRDWGAVRDRDLRDRLEQARPIVGEDGTPWGPTEFWAASVGIQPLPADLAPPEPLPTPVVDPAALCDQWRQQLAAAVIRADLDPSEAARDVAQLVPPEHRRRLRQVLLLPGVAYSSEELAALWDGREWLPVQAIARWMQEQQVTPEST